MHLNSFTKPFQIAVVGAGAAGIVAAYILQRRHSVTIFEKNDYIGGHTNTITLNHRQDGGLPIDTGFIVLNDRTYPTLHSFLSQLNVPVRTSDMSFGFHCHTTNLQYAGTGINGLFAQRKNLLRPRYYKFLSSIFRCGRTVKQDLTTGSTHDNTLGEYFSMRNFPDDVVNHYYIPMGAAIWSTPAQDMLQFPAQTFFRFFDNHGLLTQDIPKWQTVVGGSHSYVKAFLKNFNGTIHKNTPIQTIHRNQDGIRIDDCNGKQHHFNKVVIATHADEALKLLAEPSVDEKRLLGAWRYTTNHTILHTDPTVMPTNKRAWASWNYCRENNSNGSNHFSVTYHMNRLQGLNTREQYFVTLNRKQSIHEKHKIREFHYKHPMFDFDSSRTQEDLPSLNGNQNSYFCGSYFSYGFHEDAVKSGVAVAKAFGLDL